MTMQAVPANSLQVEAEQRQTGGDEVRLDKTSASSSVSSGCQQCVVGTAPLGLCTSGSLSLSEWGSLQLQEQHLLSNTARTAQDMVVVVLAKSDQDAEHQRYDTTAAKQKGKHSASDGPLRRSALEATTGVKVSCQQSPKQLTQEVCLRLLALLLIAVAAVGIAYRLAKRDN